MVGMDEVVWRGFSPAHISLIFLPRIEESLIESGSEGAGICLSDGVEATVSPGEGLSYRVNGRGKNPDFLKEFLLFLKREGLLEEVNLSVDLKIPFPLSQGYGMSAASLLSLSLALLTPIIREVSGNPVELLKVQERARMEFLSGQARSEFSESFREMITAVHRYEVLRGWGLGDVMGSVMGGVEIRHIAGVPPGSGDKRGGGNNFYQKFTIKNSMIYTAVLGGEVLTPNILSDREVMRRVKRSAYEELKALRCSTLVEEVFRAGMRFAEKTEIHPPYIIEAAKALEDVGFPSSPVMIGSTISAYVSPEIIHSVYRDNGLESGYPPNKSAHRGVKNSLKKKMDSLLEDFPIVFSRVSEIDHLGARILFK